MSHSNRGKKDAPNRESSEKEDSSGRVSANEGEGQRHLGHPGRKPGGRVRRRAAPSSVDGPQTKEEGVKRFGWTCHNLGPAKDNHGGTKQQQQEPMPGPGNPLTPLDSLQALPPSVCHAAWSWMVSRGAASVRGRLDAPQPGHGNPFQSKRVWRS